MNQTPNATTVDLVVNGMTCGGCIRRITAAVTAVGGVEQVDVDLATGSVAVTGTDLAPDAVAAAVDAAGYEVIR